MPVMHKGPRGGQHTGRKKDCDRCTTPTPAPKTTAEKVSAELRDMLAKQNAVRPTPKGASAGKVTRGKVYWDAWVKTGVWGKLGQGGWRIILTKTLPCGTKLVAHMDIPGDYGPEMREAAEKAARRVSFPDPFGY